MPKMQQFLFWTIIQTNINPAVCVFRTFESIGFRIKSPSENADEREGKQESRSGCV